MKNFKQIISKLISKNIDISEKELYTYIETPKDSKNGDYSFPCFRLAKELKKAPQVIANELKEKIDNQIKENDNIEKIEVAGGYLNFYINKKIFIHIQGNINRKFKLHSKYPSRIHKFFHYDICICKFVAIHLFR